MEFRVLGSLQAVGDGMDVDLGPPKQRALLAVLLLHLGEIVSVDRLIDALWPTDPPRTAGHSIQIYVSELRKAFTSSGAPEMIATRSPGYVLVAAEDAVDARRFERLVDEGLRSVRAGEPVAGAELLRSALALWRGPALADFTYEEFAQEAIERLSERHLDAVEELAAAELAGGAVTDALRLAEIAVRDDPLRERPREILMLALYRSGRQADALRTYQRYGALLADELGLDPSPALQRLQERILIHDEALGPTPAATGEHNPYKGLRAFTEEDARDFFGRDDLIERLVEELAGGMRLVALVGPSGSGKSSVVAAGLVPRLRGGAVAGSDGWRIVQTVPTPASIDDIATALDSRAVRREGEAGGREDGGASSTFSAAWSSASDRVLLVMDQFEDLFSIADDALRSRFLRAIAGSLGESDGRLSVVLTLRADAYDRPLLDPSFAAVFIPGVVNVVPMSTDELKEAIVSPAARAGVEIEPALLVDLVAETAAQPGALPLLQFALAELYDRMEGTRLTLAGYRAVGSLRGIVARRAEGLYRDLDDATREVVKQVMLRLVRPGHGTIDSRRRAPLAELVGLDVDAIALSVVLDSFGRHRLLSFDRDAVTGAATVEVAHEALLREWERLAGWIERHRAAIRRLDTFSAIVDEWETSGRGADYLLAGARLAEFETVVREGSLQLTGREREFLEASRERRRVEEAREAERVDRERRLRRRSRAWLVALAAAVLALTVTGGLLAVEVTGGGRPSVGYVYNGDGLFTATLLVERGFDRATADLGLVARKMSVSDGQAGDAAMRTIAQGGAGLVVVTAVDTDVDAAAARSPNTRFVVIDRPATRPNMTHLSFADNESSFLAGVAAAETSKTGAIGFIGGMDGPVIWPFEAGYEAGARAVDPQIRIEVDYLTPLGDYDGFTDPASAEATAARQYAAGVDVIFAAAGDSGTGVFKAATATPAGSPWRWAIGVDTDQYLTVGDDPGNVDFADWQKHILTSVLKRMDVGVYDALASWAHGGLSAGDVRLGLAGGDVGISYSGGSLDDLRPMIESWRSRIAAGSVAVPCIPDSRAARARALGAAAPGCGG